VVLLITTGNDYPYQSPVNTRRGHSNETRWSLSSAGGTGTPGIDLYKSLPRRRLYIPTDAGWCCTRNGTGSKGHPDYEAGQLP